MTSLLRSIWCGCSRAYTCLVVPSLQGTAVGRSFQTSSVVPAKYWRTVGEEGDPETLKVTEEQSAAVKGVDQELMFWRKEMNSVLIEGVRYDELPVVAIRASRNNTNIFGRLHTGHMLTCTSGGSVGFKNTKKKSTVAAQAAGFAMGERLLKKNIHSVRVTVEGIYNGRMPAMVGLTMAGVTVVSITDKTDSKPFQKPRKQKRR